MEMVNDGLDLIYRYLVYNMDVAGKKFKAIQIKDRAKNKIQTITVLFDLFILWDTWEILI